MTEERKRLLISIATALVLHLAVLILTGLNSFDYQVPKEFGPLLVELTPPAREVAEISEITEKPPVEQLVEDITPEAAAPAPAAPVAAPEVTETRSEPAPSLPAVSPKPAQTHREIPTYSRSEPDEDFLADLKNRTGGSDGVDARAAFGDDTVPATTDSPQPTAASGSNSGSTIVDSDAPTAREEDFTRAVRNKPVSGDTSVLADEDLSSLDQRLSTGGGPSGAAEPETSVSPVSSPAGTQSSAADSPMITFESAAASRALLDWEHPELPDNIQEEGIPRYTIVIDFFVDADGFTSGFRVRTPSGNAEIDAAVQATLRTWVFEEARTAVGSDQKKIPATLTYVIEIK